MVGFGQHMCLVKEIQGRPSLVVCFGHYDSSGVDFMLLNLLTKEKRMLFTMT